MSIKHAILLLALAAPGFSIGCAANTEDPEGILSATGDEVKEVAPGPVAVDSDSEVWKVTNAWSDKTTKAAKAAGVAWDANSGLSWEEKYSRWMTSFERVDAQNGWSKTIRITTPWGKKIDGPTLECADTAVWLRITFSSWYHLPFYLVGWDDQGHRTLYAGHFGFIASDGSAIAGFPRFRSSYHDYEGSWKQGDPWPSDKKLRTLHIGTDDEVKFLTNSDGSTAGAGSYYDEIFLNKRVGYFTRLMDAYFGSANLADGSNMFHVKPESIVPGDALLERWQKNGIGHTLPIMSVEHPSAERMKVTTASGSMPRRQAVWEDPVGSSYLFKSDQTGGVGTDSDNNAYAALGGGVRRWRTPLLNGSRWYNVVPTADKPAYIPDTDLAAIAARPARFAVLLTEDSPEQKRDGALGVIAAARNNLKQSPASCSTRTKREEGFDALYDVMQTSFDMDKAAVDKQYRTLEDYTFAELEYTKSKTCCWNSTTPAMAEIILDFAAKEKAAADAAGQCKQPTVFGAKGGGYDVFKAHAVEMGRGADWKAWSEDESCPQRGNVDDTLGAHDVRMCTAG